MLRQLHSLPGLIAALLVMILAISGAILSVDPALERLRSPPVAAGQLNVGQLAGRIANHYRGAEQIQRTASGTVIVYYSQGGQWIDRYQFAQLQFCFLAPGDQN